jgi:hypothetical protein
VSKTKKSSTTKKTTKTTKAPKATKPAPAPKAGKATKAKIRAVAFHLEAFDGDNVVPYDGPGDEHTVEPPTWFAVVPETPPAERYVYVLQRELPSRRVVLDMLADTGEQPATRIPPRGAWTRAIVDGTVHVLASDQALTRDDLSKYIGGHEPPTTPAKPPYI